MRAGSTGSTGKPSVALERYLLQLLQIGRNIGCLNLRMLGNLLIFKAAVTCPFIDPTLGHGISATAHITTKVAHGK